MPCYASGSPALVTMVQATNLLDRNNRAHFKRLHSARLRAIFVQGQVSSASMIVIRISLQMALQAALVEHD
jgi:hypothetical protein